MERTERIRKALEGYVRKNDPTEIARRKRERAAKPPRVRSCPLESWEHGQLAKFMRARAMFFIHVPNEGKRTKAQGRRLQNMGLRKGCPDFLLFDQPPVAIEMKRLRGSRVSPEQIEFLEELAKRGWRCFVTFGHKAAIRALKAAGHAAGEQDGKKSKEEDSEGGNGRYEEVL